MIDVVLAMPSPYKHPKTGVYWFRQRVPADIRSTARGRTAYVSIGARNAPYTIGTELKVSLGTKDPREAKDRASSVDTQFRAIWDTFRSGPAKLSFKNMTALSGEVYKATVQEHEEDPGSPETWGFLDSFITTMTEMDKVDPELARDVLDEFCEELGVSLPEGPQLAPTLAKVLQKRGAVLSDDDRPKMVAQTIRAQQAAFKRLAANATGDYSLDPVATSFPTYTQEVARSATLGSSTVSLHKLLEVWAGRLRQPKAKTIASYRRVVGRFVAFLKHDDAEAVTDEDIVRWHRELIQSGQVSHKTFMQTHKVALGTIYAYGMSVQGGKIVKYNPASRLMLEGEKEEVGRDKDFTAEEAIAILRSAFVIRTGNVSRMAKHRVDAIRWVPWIAAYTGARPGEICQLRKQDFVEVDGIKCFALLPDAGTVKTGRFRNVPIHSDLLKQGVWDFAIGASDGPLFYNPKANSATPWEATTGFLGEWVRNKVGVTDERISPNHAWRHWFRTKGHTAGMGDSYIDAICGHTPPTQGRKYGRFEVAALQREIEKLPPVDLGAFKPT